MLYAFFVVIGAALWATDTLFRHPLANQISALTIVYLEHVVAFGAMAVWALIYHRKELLRLSFKSILSAAFIGVFGSALATLLFTSSFQLINPSVAILLQKVQPVLVILLSAIFLKEKLNPKFWIWSALALVAAFFVSFPSGLHLNEIAGTDVRGAVLALSAAWFWAISTVAGKKTLDQTKAPVLSFWRFFFGLIALFVFSRFSTQTQVELPFIYQDKSVIASLVFMALIPGVLGVNLYYRGLANVPASIATVLELSFPLTAMWVNTHFLGFEMATTQWVAAGVLLFTIVQISRLKN